MSILPAKHSFVIWRGGTWRKSLTLYDGDSTASPLRDLTGYTASLRLEALDGTSLFTLTTVSSANGVLTLGGVAGTIIILIPASVTAAFAWQNARYELQLIDAATEVSPILWGGLTVKGV